LRRKLWSSGVALAGGIDGEAGRICTRTDARTDLRMLHANRLSKHSLSNVSSLGPEIIAVRVAV
jgi:hypothetical protein